MYTATANGKHTERKISPSINGSIRSSYTTHSLDQHQISIYKNLEQPQFEIKEVQLQFDLKHELKKVLVANSIMFLIAGSTLFKIDLESPSQLMKYSVPNLNSQSTINAWASASGEDLVLRVDQQYYYLNHNYNAFKILPKMKNLVLTTMVFTPTRTVLMGSPTGHLYLAAIKPHDDVKKNDLVHFKQVYKFDGQVQGISLADNCSTVNVVGNFALYTWPCFDTSYNELSKVFKTPPPVVKNIAHKSPKYVFTATKDKFVFAANELVTNDDEIQITSFDQNLKDLMMTTHHLVGFDDQIYIFNKLSQESKTLAFEGKILGLASDNETFWIYTDNTIYELLIYNESSLVWYDYYKMGKFEEALECLADVEENFYKRDLVLIKQGYDYLQRGGFGLETDDKDLITMQKKGIKILARSTEPFEKVCLMLNRDGSRHILLEYLLAQFSLTRRNNKVRVIVLSTWIVELMTRLEDERLHEFLKSNYKVLDKSISTVLSGADALVYAELIEDYNFILHHYLDQRDWPLAARTLAKLYLKDVEAIYENATVLLLNYPKVIDTWLRFELDYDRFLSAVLSYCSMNKGIPIANNAAIKFLQRVHEKGFKSKQLNNYYLSLLVTSAEDTESLVVRFINSEKSYDQNFILRLCILNNKIHAAVLIYIDMGLYEQALDYALQNEAIEQGEYILGKYEDIAEDGDQEHAEEQQHSKLEKESYNIRRHLWLNFAKHLIDHVCSGKDVGLDAIDKSENKLNRTLSYILGKSPLGLKDLLPLFPETIMINNFKDEIVNSLNEYKRSLQDINLKVQENSGLLRTLKQEAQQEDHRKSESYAIIEPGTACRVCSRLLITKNFIFFKNCKHGFHKECLVRFYSKSKSNYNFKRIYQNFMRSEVEKESSFKQEVDDLLCKECVLCNETNINTVDVGFLEENDKDIAEMKSWDL
ncbi:uncharacterized protein LODBEIA_P53030 [Lodderomyces beijingensis]|uniref:Pep3/Vps18/deep orange domain-containing protein n=1 Tax=Lodderomyces beijingensis TaxID=1775926 RepID=A0ABP0ZSJ2_9ASCO